MEQKKSPKTNACKTCGKSKWMMMLCFSPVILFVFLRIFFPKFIYLSALGFLICPISMGLMMYFMNKEHNHDKKENRKSRITEEKP